VRGLPAEVECGDPLLDHRIGRDEQQHEDGSEGERHDPQRQAAETLRRHVAVRPGAAGVADVGERLPGAVEQQHSGVAAARIQSVPARVIVSVK
jgi:hypothetical protein